MPPIIHGGETDSSVVLAELRISPSTTAPLQVETEVGPLAPHARETSVHHETAFADTKHLGSMKADDRGTAGCANQSGRGIVTVEFGFAANSSHACVSTGCPNGATASPPPACRGTSAMASAFSGSRPSLDVHIDEVGDHPGLWPRAPAMKVKRASRRRCLRASCGQGQCETKCCIRYSQRHGQQMEPGLQPFLNAGQTRGRSCCRCAIGRSGSNTERGDRHWEAWDAVFSYNALEVVQAQQIHQITSAVRADALSRGW